MALLTSDLDERWKIPCRAEKENMLKIKRHMTETVCSLFDLGKENNAEKNKNHLSFFAFTEALYLFGYH